MDEVVQTSGDAGADCIFCNIANKSINAEIVHEDEQLMVIQDILPKAPVHLLVVPKQHIVSINDVTSDQRILMGDMIVTAQTQAKEKGIAETGYKLIFNVGKDGGQTVPHMHLHLLGGKPLGD